MSEKKNNPYVSKATCDAIQEGVQRQLTTITGDIKEIKENTKQWKTWLFGVASSVISALIIYVLTKL